jgi:tetratricopeptide (TPR) repeat protein
MLGIFSRTHIYQFAGLFFLFVTQFTHAEVNEFVCGSLENAYGPFDYRTNKKELPVVDHFHFKPQVENLIRGTTGSLGQDIDYTLRAFPNHPRALMAMVRLGEKLKTENPSGASHSVECYLFRASRFRPEDGMVSMIYAIYLSKKNRPLEAVKYLDDAVASGEASANFFYNSGLIYLEVKDYEKALAFAHKAYRLGYPLRGLRDQLKKIGKWEEPVPVVKSTKPSVENQEASSNGQ